MDEITEEIVGLTEETYRLFRGWNLEFFDRLDPEIDFQTPFGDVRGVDRLIAYLEGVGGAFEDPHPDPEEFVPAGDRLLVLGRWRGTGKASGISIEPRFAHVLQYRDGKIASLHVYVDSAKMVEAMTPPAPGSEARG